jgi:DNA-directed RNA polymerase specialized sigma24 family protein
VLVLTEWLDMDAKEAAKVLGMKPASVRVRLHRARVAFRERMGDSDG